MGLHGSTIKHENSKTKGGCSEVCYGLRPRTACSMFNIYNAIMYDEHTCRYLLIHSQAVSPNQLTVAMTRQERTHTYICAIWYSNRDTLNALTIFSRVIGFHIVLQCAFHLLHAHFKFLLCYNAYSIFVFMRNVKVKSGYHTWAYYCFMHNCISCCFIMRNSCLSCAMQFHIVL